MTAFVLTNRLCHQLTRQERLVRGHGRETGRIVMDTQGGFTEIHTRPAHSHVPIDSPDQPFADTLKE
ncbi:hypothetical protein E1293_19265 [Actinomadura darangshiensis]|uniref:Uncharacterized protein n=1 Tax=Actinomadura darangshiensis TaxID=705336 RepID=A0A4R5B876_9ACTN|nr:hypothetical protein [Actinomadura darangshiensis]TDD81169.1 hypothetical protein E1293_19265 [Actinomadura darangshiensis]